MFDILLLYMTLFSLCYVCEVTVVVVEQHSSKRHTHIYTLEYKKRAPQTKSRACLYLIKVNERLLSSVCRPAVI